MKIVSHTNSVMMITSFKKTNYMANDALTFSDFSCVYSRAFSAVSVSFSSFIKKYLSLRKTHIKRL